MRSSKPCCLRPPFFFRQNYPWGWYAKADFWSNRRQIVSKITQVRNSGDFVATNRSHPQGIFIQKRQLFCNSSLQFFCVLCNCHMTSLYCRIFFDFSGADISPPPRKEEHQGTRTNSDCMCYKLYFNVSA